MSYTLKIQPKANNIIRDAEAYIQGKHNVISQFNSLEELVVSGEGKLDEKTYRGLMFHMLSIRSNVVNVLWKNEIYIGVSIIDDLVFQFSKSSPGRIYQEIFSFLSISNAEKSGFILYPLHGFGVEKSPMFTNDAEIKPFLHFKELGVCLSPQSNNLESAIKRVSEMARKLGVVGKIDPSDLTHHVLAGNMDWFKCNPLMMVRIASHTGAYYENQFIYTLKIRIAAALVAMLYALGAERGYQVDKFYSSANVNNWETLDFRHYVIGEARSKKSELLDLRRIPMNVSALDLARLSDLPVVLSSKTLKQAFLKSALRRIVLALRVVESGHLSHVNLNSKDKVRGRVFSRIVTALDWYRQSFSARVTDDEAVVALAVAFETLLTDYYSPGVSARIQRRVRICLKGRHGIAEYLAAVISIMKARGAIVHNGSSVQEAEIIKAQAAFALCFGAVTDKLQNIGSSIDNPIGVLLGD